MLCDMPLDRWRSRPGGDVPIDRADAVARNLFADLGEPDAAALEHAEVVRTSRPSTSRRARIGSLRAPAAAGSSVLAADEKALATALAGCLEPASAQLGAPGLVLTELLEESRHHLGGGPGRVSCRWPGPGRGPGAPGRDEG